MWVPAPTEFYLLEYFYCFGYTEVKGLKKFDRWGVRYGYPSDEVGRLQRELLDRI
jgi:hypothetical protein